MIRIKELREVKGLQQKDLAIDLGVTQPTISGWESGIKVPSARNTQKLADYFGVSVDFLLGRDEKEPASVSADGQADKLAKALDSIGIDVESLSESEINRIARLAKVALEE